MKEEIKNCPFCGAEPKSVEDNRNYRVRCKNIACAIRPKTDWYMRKEDAIVAWNRRV